MASTTIMAGGGDAGKHPADSAADPPQLGDWRRDARHRTVAGLLLASPMTLLLCVAFVAPLLFFLARSIDNTEVPRALPHTVAAIEAWSGDGLPDETVFRALVEDLHAIDPDSGVIGHAARRLNYEEAGFRALLMRTFTQRERLSVATAREDVLALDSRWQQTKYWRVIRRNTESITDYYYLTAFDRVRDSEDRIVAASGERTAFLVVIGRTVWISAVVTVVCVLFGFPVAKFLAAQPPSRANLLLFFVLLPFWTPLLVRTTSLIIVLSDQGVVNDLLLRLGLIRERVQLVFNRIGVYIGMTQYLLPFAILPLFNVMRATDPSFVRAALSLGATPWQAFRDVYLPQVLPGVYAGALLVFVLSLGYYILPALLGGPQDQMISYLVAYYTDEVANWGLASALGTILLVMTLAFYLLYARVSLRGDTVKQ